MKTTDFTFSEGLSHFNQVCQEVGMGRSQKVTAYVCRSRIPTDESQIVTIWSNSAKARSWIESRVCGSVKWTEDEGSNYAVTAEVDGSIVGRVREAEIIDPVGLSNQYPDQLPGYQRITDENPVIPAVDRGDDSIVPSPSND